MFICAAHDCVCINSFKQNESPLNSPRVCLRLCPEYGHGFQILLGTHTHLQRTYCQFHIGRSRQVFIFTSLFTDSILLFCCRSLCLSAQASQFAGRPMEQSAYGLFSVTVAPSHLKSASCRACLQRAPLHTILSSTTSSARASKGRSSSCAGFASALTHATSPTTSMTTKCIWSVLTSRPEYKHCLFCRRSRSERQ